MMSSKLQKLIGKPVVVLLLLNRVVESRVTKVLFTVRNKETFQLKGNQQVFAQMRNQYTFDTNTVA